jgi:hypothetical protein
MKNASPFLIATLFATSAKAMLVVTVPMPEPGAMPTLAIYLTGIALVVYYRWRRPNQSKQ